MVSCLSAIAHGHCSFFRISVQFIQRPDGGPVKKLAPSCSRSTKTYMDFRGYVHFLNQFPKPFRIHHKCRHRSFAKVRACPHFNNAAVFAVLPLCMFSPCYNDVSCAAVAGSARPGPCFRYSSSFVRHGYKVYFFEISWFTKVLYLIPICVDFCVDSSGQSGKHLCR